MFLQQSDFPRRTIAVLYINDKSFQTTTDGLDRTWRRCRTFGGIVGACSYITERRPGLGSGSRNGGGLAEKVLAIKLK